MKKLKTLISLGVSLTLLMPALPGSVALADEIVKVQDKNGAVVEAVVDAKTGDVIVVDAEEKGSEEESGKEGEEIKEEEVNKFPPAKLSGVDFVHVYDDRFETVSDYLRKFGIFSDTDTEADIVLTRGEFAVLAARILNDKNGGIMPAYRFEFKDVDETASYYSAVNTLSNYGFVEGDGNGYFYPENEIKSAEAVIILMNMLGYSEIARLRGSGDSGYRNLAVNMKFTKEVPFNYSTTVTLKKAARLIYHALHERVAEGSSYSTDFVTFTQSNDTLMYRYMGVYTIEGIVSANEFTSLNSKEEKTDEKNIMINDTILRFDDEALNPQDYLGLYARVYYKNDSGKNEAIFIEAVSEKYELLKINAKDIEGFDRETKNLTYTENKKVKTEKIGMDMKIIFNSAAVGGNIHEKYFTPDVGQLVFIDNNRDNKYDILIIDSYSTYVAKGKLSDAEGTLRDELGVHNSLSLADKNVRIYMNNEKADYSAISSGDVVFVEAEKVRYAETASVNPITYQTIDTSSEYIKLLASDSKISGTVNSYNEEYIYVDSAEYEYSNGFCIAAAVGVSPKAFKSTRLNVAISGRLDLNGDIAWLSKTVDENIKYAYMVKTGEGERPLSNNKIKLYTQDDEMVTFVFDDKVKVYNLWGGPGSDVSTSTYYAKTFSGNEIAAECSQLETRQLIKYRLSEDGKVKEIYLAADDSGRDYFNDIPMLQEGIFYYSTDVKHTEANSIYYMSFGNNGIIEPFFLYNKNKTVAFDVPSDSSDPNVLDDERYYRAYSPSASGNLFSHAQPISSGVKLYDIDNSVVGAALVRKEKKVSTVDTGVHIKYTATFYEVVVDSIKYAYDSMIDEYVAEISAWYLGKLKKYKLSKDDLISNDIMVDESQPDKGFLPESKKDDYQLSHSKVSVSELVKGDVLILHLDGLGYVDGFKVVHRPMYILKNATENPFNGYEYDFSGSKRQSNYAVNHIYLGTGVFAAGPVVKMAGSAPIVNTNQGALRRMMMYGSSSNVQILIYDVREDKITTSLNSSKNPTFSNCEDGDYLFWYQYERYPNVVLVVRNYW